MLRVHPSVRRESGILLLFALVQAALAAFVRIIPQPQPACMLEQCVLLFFGNPLLDDEVVGVALWQSFVSFRST